MFKAAVKFATFKAILSWFLLDIQRNIVTAQDTSGARMVPASKEWMGGFANEDLGCTGPSEDTYIWREAGYGSNVNFLMVAWANAIAEGRRDLSVVVNTEDFFSRTTCAVASNGLETGVGWSCIFAPMPHLCAFDTLEDVASFNQRKGLSQAVVRQARRRQSIPFLQGRAAKMAKSRDHSGVETMEIFANLYEYLLSNLQPWCKADVQAILDEPEIAALRSGHYVSMHIRRTDKISIDQAEFTTTETYFDNVAKYLQSTGGGLSAADITGLWLSTDEEAAVDEVRSLVPNYFPNIKPEAVMCISGRVQVRPLVRGPTMKDGDTDRNTYEARVLLLAEMSLLAGAEVFSGTLSSNLGRVIALMRYSLGKPKESVLSGDAPHAWQPARQRRLRY
ncbi:unnamed protein product [Ectocarpus sp. 12 AP-2014]